MLSKDEILIKKGKTPRQLDLVDDLNHDKDKFKSRLLLILFLFLTVGVSSGLWIFREYKDNKLNFNFSLNLPSIQTPVTTDQNIWQICFFDKNTGTKLYQQNCTIADLPQDKVENNIDLIKSSLPNGLIINESISTSSTDINYVSQISSPKFNYFVTIKIYGSHPLDASQKQIPKTISELYWKFSK
jgi:hypothetical protein